ncbi:unnamed protein product [Prunus armeniaca]
MAFGIRIPFEWCEGRRREPHQWRCLLNFIGLIVDHSGASQRCSGHLPSLLKLLGLRVDHSGASQRCSLAMCAVLVKGIYGVRVVSQPPYWLKSVVHLGCPVGVTY